MAKRKVWKWSNLLLSILAGVFFAVAVYWFLRIVLEVITQNGEGNSLAKSLEIMIFLICYLSAAVISVGISIVGIPLSLKAKKEGLAYKAYLALFIFFVVVLAILTLIIFLL